jgi:hypothetical protein
MSIIRLVVKRRLKIKIKTFLKGGQVMKKRMTKDDVYFEVIKSYVVRRV